MSSKRSSAMASIHKYTAEDIKNAASPDDAVAMFLGKPVPSMAPGTQPSVEKDTVKTDVAGQTDEESQKIEGPSILDRGVGAGYDFVRSFYRSTTARLEGIPIPGGIGVPLGILFILFLLLLPVNGHTRIMWLWLAITGQAQIGGALTPITALSAPPNNSPTSYNTGSPSVNPNQTGTSSSSSNTTASNAPVQHTIVSHTKHNTTVVTNQHKNHTTGKNKGGGPGPYENTVPDPTAPITQVSYSYLLRGYNGYE